MESVLEALGWGPFFASQVTDAEQRSLVPGRVVADRGPRLGVWFEDGERDASVPGRFKARGLTPVVGDFVLCPAGDAPPLARVLDRRTQLSRGAAGRATAEQVLAANVDVVFVVQALDAGVHPRRLERTIAAVLGGGAAPVIVLTKSDLSLEVDLALTEARTVAATVPVITASAVTRAGLDEVSAFVPPGRTAVFIGPSGAGKSTLVNALLDAPVQETRPVRAHDLRGRHATTARHLFLVPGGGALIDSPGIRELKLWESGSLDVVFDDITAIADACRFRDCGHHDEPGCAVREAVQSAALDPARLENFHKLQREAQALEARRDAGAARAEKERWRAVSREIRRLQRRRGRDE